jgi:hypothetical protein
LEALVDMVDVGFRGWHGVCSVAGEGRENP